VLTALPPLMLMIGLWVYYRAEQQQHAGAPILAEQIQLQGQYKGMSSLGSLGEQQLFLWLDTAERSRGLRINADQKQTIEQLSLPLEPGDQLSVQVAPRVVDSRIYWLLSISRNGESVL